MRFGNPLNLLSVQATTPGTLLGNFLGLGVPDPGQAGQFIMPASTRSIAIYSGQNMPVGATVRVTTTPPVLTYLPLTPFPTDGVMICRVSPEVSTGITVTFAYPAVTLPFGEVICSVVALTDAGSMAVFDGPGGPPISGIPSNAYQAWILAQAGPSTTPLVAGQPGVVLRIWDSWISLESPTAAVDATAVLRSSVTHAVFANARAFGPAAVNAKGAAGGFPLHAGDGIELVIAGAGSIADAGFVIDNVNV